MRTYRFKKDIGEYDIKQIDGSDASDCNDKACAVMIRDGYYGVEVWLNNMWMQV